MSALRTRNTLYFSYFLMSFAFFGLLAVLLLFFIRHLGLSDKAAYQFFGNFGALNYIAEFLGSVIAGRYLGFRTGAFLGLALMIPGCIYLTINQHSAALTVGLTLFACGNGLLAPNLRNLYGACHYESNARVRDDGFTVLHACDTAGQFFAPIVLAYLMLINPRWVFFTMTVAAVLCLVNLIVNYRYIPSVMHQHHHSSAASWQAIKGCVLVIATLGFVGVILYYRDVAYVLETTLIIVGVALPIFLYREKQTLRIPVLTSLFPLLGLLISDLCFRMIGAPLKLFTKTYVIVPQMWIPWVGHIIIPVSALQSMDPLFLVCLIPWVFWVRKKASHHHIDITSGNSIALGLLFVALSFFCLVLGMVFSNHGHVAFIWLVLFYAIIAIGELFILPAALAAITRFAPLRWKGAMMGLLSLVISLSSYLSSWLGELISPLVGNPTLSTYRDLFGSMTTIALLGGAIFFVLWRAWLRQHSGKIQRLSDEG